MFCSGKNQFIKTVDGYLFMFQSEVKAADLIKDIDVFLPVLASMLLWTLFQSSRLCTAAALF